MSTILKSALSETDWYSLKRSASQRIALQTSTFSEIAKSPEMSSASSGDTGVTHETNQTRATSMLLTPLQAKEGISDLQPIGGSDDDPRSFDLVGPPTKGDSEPFSLEKRSGQLFSSDHLRVIFSDPSLLSRFTAFLSEKRPQSVSILVYYLDAMKALKAISYSNAVAQALEHIPGHDFTARDITSTSNLLLENKATLAFDVLVREDLPAYISHLYVNVVSRSITKRINGTLPPNLREASEGLAEVFCLTDPSRPDNPIVFASEGMFLPNALPCPWLPIILFVIALKLKYALNPFTCRVPPNNTVWYQLCYWS